MAHEDVVREIVRELDHVIRRVQTLTQRDDTAAEATNAYDDLRVARFWLQEIGHRSHFDTPVREDEHEGKP